MEKQKRLRLTVLCENVIANLRGVGEHGFALFVETDAGAYLFDTGSGIGLLRNSLTFGCSLASIGKIILSHGHYDHTGGLRDVLAVTGPMEVHGHPAIFEDKYLVMRQKDAVKRIFIGMPFRREALEGAGADFRLDPGFREIGRGIFLTGEIPRDSSREPVDGNLAVKRGDVFETDPVPDDGALVVSTEKGLVVLLGCAHAGIVNTLDHVRRNLPGAPFHAVIGGTHWGIMDRDAAEISIRAVLEMEIGTLGLCHCTGIGTAARLMRDLKDRCFYASVGTEYEV